MSLPSVTDLVLHGALTQTAAWQTLFVERWPFWAGGVAIGGFLILFLVGANKMLGVSTGYADACAVAVEPAARASWRLPFLVGIVGGGLLAALLGGWNPSFAVALFDDVVSSSMAVKAVTFTSGGVLLGFGARLAGGCTSGHSIAGIAQLAPSSLVATAGFMAAGFTVTNLLLRSLGA